MNLIFKILILLIPVLFLIVLYVYHFRKERKNKKGKGTFISNAKNAFSKLFYIYQQKQKAETTYETISEDEPSVRKFRCWMQDISVDLKEKGITLILVFDNMDRLPKAKVQELWSSIHTFFAEKTPYENIRVIVPFDRAHIKEAFNGNIKEDKFDFGDDFIDKTFNVVYRVSPPVLSDWKNFFLNKWNDAFGIIANQEEYERVIQVYGLLIEVITPRKIIAFINEFVSIKQLHTSISDRYIAIFIAGKNEILENPFSQIITPTYLKSASFIYENDDELSKNIGALVYQIEPERALQVIYTEKLKRALNDNNIDAAKIISKSIEFDEILESVVPTIENIENTILCLSSLDNKIKQYVWDDISLKVKSIDISDQKIKKYQKIILGKSKNPNLFLKSIFEKYRYSQTFISTDYYNSINELSELNTEKKLYLLIEENLIEFKTKVEVYISFIRIAKEKHEYYKIFCDDIELDNYLSLIQPIEDLEKIDYLSYIVDNYDLPKFIERLTNDITSNISNKSLIAMLLKRLKEASKRNKPIKQVIDDVNIYTLFVNSTESEDLYYELIAMRIAQLNLFHTSYSSAFEAALNTSDIKTIHKVAEKIEFYITYGDILLNLTIFMNYPLYKGIVQELTNKHDDTCKLSIDSILAKFKSICVDGDIEPDQLITKLNSLKASISKSITPQNIKIKIPDVYFFVHAVRQKIILQNTV